jgi:hypothetical protein
MSDIVLDDILLYQSSWLYLLYLLQQPQLPPQREFYSLLILYLIALKIILTALLVPFDLTNIAQGNSLA